MLRRTVATLCVAAKAARFVPLRDVPTQRSWEFTEPTLVKAGRYTTREEWAVDDADVVDFVARKFPTLSRLMAAGDLTLKGGAIASLLMGATPSDLDLYVAGTASVEEAQTRARQVLQAAVDVTVERALAVEQDKIDAHQRVANGQFAFANRKGDGDDDAQDQHMVPLTTEDIAKRLHAAKGRALAGLHGMRRGGVITVVGVPGVEVPIQISLRPYATVEELILDGDVDAGAIGMNAERGLMISERGAFALQNWCIRAVDRADPTRSLSAARLQSYFDRGFDVILPHFDVDAVRPPIKRVDTPTCFELCDGQLFVETDLSDAADPRLTNRIQVTGMHRASAAAAGGGLATAEGGLGSGAAAESAAVASVEESESSVPEGLFVTIGSATARTKHGEAMANALRRRELQKSAVKSVRHNVRELLRGGRRFHTLLSGTRILSLADLREVPVTLRNVESTLHGAAKAIAKDPFSPQALRQLLYLFPGQPPVAALSAMLPPSDGAAADVGLQRHVGRVLEGLQRRQLEEAAALLDKCQAALRAEPLDALLPPPLINAASPEAFYGARYTRSSPMRH